MSNSFLISTLLQSMFLIFLSEVAAVRSTYLDLGAAVEASCQQLPGLDGHRRQLPLFVQNVSNGVDVGHAGLLLIIHWNLSIPGDPQMSVVLQFWVGKVHFLPH